MSNELEVLDNYVAYVVETVDRLQTASNLIKNDMVTAVEINTALALFMQNSLILMSEKTRLQYELEKAQEEFDRWFEPILVKTRNEMQKDLSKSTKVAKDEVEIQARVNNQEDYYNRKAKVDELRQKTDFISSLSDRYSKMESILKTLSNNMNSEMHFFGVENRINKNANVDNVKNGVDGLAPLKVRSRI